MKTFYEVIHRIFPLYGLLNFALSLWQNQCKITSIIFVVAHDISYRMHLLSSMCLRSPVFLTLNEKIAETKANKSEASWWPLFPLKT